MVANSLVSYRLEKPCMDHMQMLCVQSQQSMEDEISGHALMATCPTRNHLIERPDIQYGHQMPEMNASDLLKLLDLSNRLPLDAEITPIMAWASILHHPYVKYLTGEDFVVIKADLLAKVRCYGFVDSILQHLCPPLTFKPASEPCLRSLKSKTLSRTSCPKRRRLTAS